MLSRRENEATWSCRNLPSLQNKAGSRLVGGWIVRGVAEFLQQYRNDSFSPCSPSPNRKKKKFLLFTYFLEYVILLEVHFTLLL